MSTSTSTKKAPEDKQEQSSLLTKIWAEIAGYDELSRRFRADGETIYRQYVNEPITATADLQPGSRFDIVWSNTQLLQPIVFSQMPQPFVERRFKDKDPQGRRASLILERCLKAVLSLQDTVGQIKQARDDYLLVGRGQLWLRYAPIMGMVQVVDELGQPVLDENGQPLMEEALRYENVEIDYVPWKDFGYSSAKVWGGVKSVWRHLYLTKEDAKKQLGKEAAGKLKYTYTGCDDPKRTKEEESGMHKRARVTEFWDYDKKKVYWISDSDKNSFLKVKDDFLQLGRFFPCPKPLFATKRTDSLIPTSDFSIVRYLIEELDIVTRREAFMVEAMKASGVSSAQVSQALKSIFESDDNIIEPIKEWLVLKQQGGASGGAIEWLPLEMFAKVLEQLRARKEELKNDIYELTGISDVIRGTTNPYESGKALEQKSQWASQRINEKQRLVQEFIRDMVNIIAEIISEHFEDATIYEMAGVDMLGPEYIENFAADVALLRDDVTRNFRIDVTLESLVQADEEKEKAAVNEFINAVAQIMGQSQAIVQVMPELKPVMMEAVKLAASRYKAGRTLEGLLDTKIDEALQAEELAKQQPPQPDPAQMLAEFEAETNRLKVDNKAAIDSAKNEGKAMLDQAKLSFQNEVERERIANERARIDLSIRDLQIKEAKAALDAERERAKTVLEQKELQFKTEMEAFKLKLEQADLKLQQAKTEAENQIALLTLKAQTNQAKADMVLQSRAESEKIAAQKESAQKQAKESAPKVSEPKQSDAVGIATALAQAIKSMPQPVVNVAAPKPTKRVGKIKKGKDGSATVVVEEEFEEKDED